MEQDESCNKHSDNFSIMLYSCIEPTEMYVSTSEFSPNPTIDYWEEV